MNDDNPYRSPREYGEGGWSVLGLIEASFGVLTMTAFATEVTLIAADVLIFRGKGPFDQAITMSTILAIIAWFGWVLAGPRKKR